MNNLPPECFDDMRDAPWNQHENTDEEVEVSVVLTISKTFKILTKDYEIEEEGVEDGTHYRVLNFNNVNFEREVYDQVILPHLAHKYTPDLKAKSDLKGWEINDIDIFQS